VSLGWTLGDFGVCPVWKLHTNQALTQRLEEIVGGLWVQPAALPQAAICPQSKCRGLCCSKPRLDKRTSSSLAALLLTAGLAPVREFVLVDLDVEFRDTRLQPFLHVGDGPVVDERADFRRSQAVRERIPQWTGIPCGIGIGPTKTLAKLANHVATSADRKPGSYPVEFARVADQGQPCIGFETVAAAKKEIACTRSFGNPIEQLKDLIEAVTDFCSRAAEKLRKQDGHAVQVLVFIHTSPFRHQDRQYSRSVTVPLRRPTAGTALIAASAIRGLKAIFKPDYQYAKAGVMLLDLLLTTWRLGHERRPGENNFVCSRATLALARAPEAPPVVFAAGARTVRIPLASFGHAVLD
jgi:hypothetical protein